MLEKTLRIVVLCGIFALPFIVFIVADKLFFPFITGKNFTFRIIVEIITGAYLALMLVNPAYRPRRSYLLYAFTVFVIIVALADALGVYPFKSFWSNYERMDGWITLAHLFLYFVITSAVLNTEKLWRTFWHVSLAVSSIVALYGLLQVFGILSLAAGFESTQRIAATFGNPIYLAAYMLFNVGIAASLLARSWQENSRGSRTLPTILYGGIIILDTAILLMTGTRGTIIGLAGGTLLSLLLVGILVPEVRRVAFGILIGFLLLAGGLFLIRNQSFVQHVPFLQRLATISIQDNTTKARFYNWGMALQGFKERPILGWGQENYAIVFDKYYDPRMYAQEQWFDRVHDIVFDWLVAAGILGLLSYLSIIGIALIMLWRSAFTVYEKSILTGLIAAYFFHNLFVFDNITSYVLFATVLAYIAWRGSATATFIPFPNLSLRLLPVAAACAVVVVWGSAWFINGRALAANRALLQALSPQQAGVQTNLDLFKQSIAYHTIGTQEAREQLAQAAAQVARIDSIPVATKQAFLDTAASEMTKMMQESPLDARFPLFLGVMLDSYGDYAQATLILEKAHELSPKKQTILFELASNYLARGDMANALAKYKEAYDLAPEFQEAALYYAGALIRAGQDKRAEEILAPLIENGTAADPRIAGAYVSRGRYDKVAQIWEAHLKVQPNDVQGYFTLAAAYYGAGDQARAVAVLQKVAEIAPGAKAQADAVIEQIRKGTVKLTQ